MHSSQLLPPPSTLEKMEPLLTMALLLLINGTAPQPAKTGKTKTSTGKVHLMVTSPETTRTVHVMVTSPETTRKVPEMRKTREAAAVTQEVRREAHQAVAKSKKMNSNSNSLSLSAKDQAHLTLKKVPVLKIRKVPEMSPRRAAAVAHVAHAQTSPKTMKTSLETMKTSPETRKVPKTTRTKMIRTKR